jgi:hypothetical protein
LEVEEEVCLCHIVWPNEFLRLAGQFESKTREVTLGVWVVNHPIYNHMTHMNALGTQLFGNTLDSHGRRLVFETFDEKSHFED